MLGDSSVLESSGGDGGGMAMVEFRAYSSEEEKNCDRKCGGNRWPQEETLALIKIRSEMDIAFLDSSPKAPLWEEVSRKLAELGYHRSAKKCKEKFENIYKYHKRTKENRTGKPESKTYRFFQQLEALQHTRLPSLPPQQATPWMFSFPTQVTVPLVGKPVIKYKDAAVLQTGNPPTPANMAEKPVWGSPSSSTASDEKLKSRKSRKRKWEEFFRRITKEVIQKQQELQKKFLETIERCENQRFAREEAWRRQEMARMSEKHEILLREHSSAAAKYSSIVAFLEKISGTEIMSQSQFHLYRVTPPVHSNDNHINRPQEAANSDILKIKSAEIFVPVSSSRWPKEEVEELINLRTSLDAKYPESGPKGPLWEEISASMRRMGYNRSAKKCKEKWENINKYFKRIKESNTKRREDSKTCPYYLQLDALYKEKNKDPVSFNLMEPLWVRPEQQWPPAPEGRRIDLVMEEIERNDSQEEKVGGGGGEGENTEKEDDQSGCEKLTNKEITELTEE